MVKKWSKLKLVQDIQVFLGFTNFYWQFIQGFSKIAAPFISMLKTIVLPERLTLEWLGVGNGKVDGFGVGQNSVEHAKKSRKLFKSGKSKSEKMFKS